MIGHQHPLAGLRNDGLAYRHFGAVEIQHIAVLVQRRTAHNRQIHLELLDQAHRGGANQPTIGAAQRATGHHHLDLWIGHQDIGNIQVIGHNQQITMGQQRAGHGLGRGANG